MAIEDLGNGGVIVTPDRLAEPRADGSDGTDDIARFRIITMKSGLYLESKGMTVKRGRSIYAIVKQEFGLHGNKRSVYEQFCKMHNLPTHEESKAARRG